MRISETDLIINGDGTCFHLHLAPEELADNVILVGDPGRVEMVANKFDEIEYTRSNREFVTATGQYNGKRVTVLSTGIGTDNCDIVMNELDALANIDFSTREIKENKRSLNILRIGTSGAIQEDIPLGSYVFARMSLGCDGLMNWYGNIGGIERKDFAEAFKSQVGWTDRLGEPYFINAGEDMTRRFSGHAVMGITISAQGFYGPQGRILRLPLAIEELVDKFHNFEHQGQRLTNFEMESSAIAGIGALLGHNCGTICLIIAQRNNRGANTDYKKKMNELVTLALDRLTSE